MADSPSGSRDVVREIAWQEVLPGLCLFRAVTLALHPSKLLLATLGMLLMFAGWNLLAWPFSGSNETATQEMVRSDAAVPEGFNRRAASEFGFAVGRVRSTDNPLFGAWAHLSYPWRALFLRESTTSTVALGMLWSLWALLVWTFCGGTITRIAALQLTRQPSASMVKACRFTCSRWPSYFAAPLFPLVGVLLTILMLLPVGLLARLDFGMQVVAVLWPLVMLAGLLLALITVALLFGWPLMWGTLSTEGLDMFEALSRTYAYVYQRPWHFVGYVILAAILGAIGWMAVDALMGLILYLAAWGVSWGSGTARFQDILRALTVDGTGVPGGGIFEFWGDCIRFLTYAYGYSYFWTNAAAIYLLLRHSTDDTEMDDVYLEEGGPKAPLPELAMDSAGVPKVANEPKSFHRFGESTPQFDSQREESSPPAAPDTPPDEK